MTVELLNIINNYKKVIEITIDKIDARSIIAAADILTKASVYNDNVYIGGNGACASLSEHWACDHTKGASTAMFNNNVIGLSSNMALITAIGNDIAFDQIFSFQIAKLTLPASPGVVVLMSASGKSPNIIKAAEFVKNERPGIKLISLTGFEGEPLKSLSHVNIHVPLMEYEGVEDIHTSIMHILARCVKHNLNKLNIVH